MKMRTKAIHAGQAPDPSTGAVIPPIYMTSTYAQKTPAEHQGYEYTRAGNPNFTVAEQQIAALEGAAHATIFSSGLGALTALLATFTQGDSVIAIEGLYGGTYRLFHSVFKQLGIELTSVKSCDVGRLEELIQQNTRLLLFETPTNPLLQIHDIESLASIAKKRGVVTLVDNTFATPCLQNPLAWGATLVWHSCTKYLGGHSDIVSGAMATNDPKLKEALDFSRMAIGVNPSPFDAWLLTRSIKTLELRMRQQTENAGMIANFFHEHPLAAAVYYPGLPDHPGHAIAKKQMRGFGAMVAVEFNLSGAETKKLISSLRYFTLAESLGCVESLVNHPASMTHASIPKHERQALGITDSLVRFSVGIEDVEDLLEDLQKRLASF